MTPDRAIQVSGTAIEAEIRGPLGTIDQGTAHAYLVEESLDPTEWEATHFRKIKYGKDTSLWWPCLATMAALCHRTAIRRGGSLQG